MLPVPGLEFASRAQALYPPFILVPPVPLNLAFLIMFPSWDLVIPHLCALNEVGCGLSFSNRPDEKGYQPCPFWGHIPTARQSLLADGYSLSQGWSAPSQGTVWTRRSHGEHSSTSTPLFLLGGMAYIFLGSNFVSCTSRCLNFDRVQCLL